MFCMKTDDELCIEFISCKNHLEMILKWMNELVYECSLLICHAIPLNFTKRIERKCSVYFCIEFSRIYSSIFVLIFVCCGYIYIFSVKQLYLPADCFGGNVFNICLVICSLEIGLDIFHAIDTPSKFQHIPILIHIFYVKL